MKNTRSLSQGFSGLFGTVEFKPRQSRPVQRKPAPKTLRPTPPLQPLQIANLVKVMLVEYFTDRDVRNPAKEAVEFMRAHAGCAIMVPTLSTIERIALDDQVVRAIDRDPSPQTAVRVSTIAGIPRRQIGKIVKRKTGVGVEKRRAMHCRQPRMSRFRRVWVV